jgi:hypothetical protein
MALIAREDFVRSFLMLMTGAIVLGGCAATEESTHWTKPGTTQEAFLRDRAACIQETEQWNGWVQGGSRETCLEARGYKKDPNGGLFASPEAVKNPLGAALGTPNPGAAATSTQTAIGQDYSRAVSDYRNCLAANPSHVNACDGLRHIMDSDAQILSGSTPPQQNNAGTPQGR